MVTTTTMILTNKDKKIKKYQLILIMIRVKVSNPTNKIQFRMIVKLNVDQLRCRMGPSIPVKGSMAKKMATVNKSGQMAPSTMACGLWIWPMVKEL